MMASQPVENQQRAYEVCEKKHYTVVTLLSPLAVGLTL
jgi:hypothetical protein